MGSSGTWSRCLIMARLMILGGIMLCGSWLMPAAAESACFSADDSREQVVKHGLIPLHDIVRSARSASTADLISARLCETSGNMVYMIAMLGRDGRLARLTVDARTGNLINMR
jgi:uncharacterized membrane protein YkoI